MLVTRSSIVREQATQAADVDKRLGIETIGQLIATIQAADDFRADRAAGRDASQNRAHVGKLLVTLRLTMRRYLQGWRLDPRSTTLQLTGESSATKATRMKLVSLHGSPK